MSQALKSHRSGADRLWSRRDIEGLIADGSKIIILDNQVIKADAWLPFHPGGDKAILHMIGRDGTDEIRALHSSEAQERMKKFVIGRISGRWTNFVPPIQGGVFRRIEDNTQTERMVIEDVSGDSSPFSSRPPSPIFETADHEFRRRRSIDMGSLSSASSLSLPTSDAKDLLQNHTSAQIAADIAQYPSLSAASQDTIIAKYRELNVEIRAAGLYQCHYSDYAFEGMRYALIFMTSMCLLHYSQYALSAAFLGLFWHQLAFTAHDAGHMGITHDFHIDTCIGIFIAEFLGGLSIGWWKRNHNVHHIVTNSPEHDPDIEHMPFFAISHRFFSSLRSTYYDRAMPFDAVAKWAVKYQNFFYYPLLTLGRFNLYVQSWTYLLSPTQAPRKGPARWHRPLELLGQVFFWYWFGYLLMYRSIPNLSSRLTFLFISHMVTAPLHVQITLSHFAMSTSDLGPHESFPQKMLRTTMDVDCPTWLDWLHGGLQFQVVHHLFPRIPRHNLRKAQKHVVRFCEETNIPYVRYGFVQGNGEVLGRLGEIAKQARIYEECQRVAAGELVGGHED